MPAAAPKARRSTVVRLRRFRAQDFPTVRRLWRRSGLHLGPSDRWSVLERTLRRDPDLFLVAEVEGRVVGAVLGRYDGRRGWANHLAVEPTARSQGIGSRLMRELERRLVVKGCRKLNLHVMPGNRSVCPFYEGIGYRRAEIIFLEKWLRS